jgi:hypothetical protein
LAKAQISERSVVALHKLSQLTRRKLMTTERASPEHVVLVAVAIDASRQALVQRRCPMINKL